MRGRHEGSWEQNMLSLVSARHKVLSQEDFQDPSTPIFYTPFFFTWNPAGSLLCSFVTVISLPS